MFTIPPLQVTAIVAVCLTFVIPSAQTYVMEHEPALSPKHLQRDQLTSSLSTGLINATNFEASNRAHGPVSQDPFYTTPNDTESVKPGTLLKLEKETNTSLYTIAPSLSLSRFLYQSKTSNGSLVPVSAYILWPYTARPHHDGYPVVAWAHGTSGLSADCAPSNIRNLWHHFQAPYQLALQGYVVVATDYAGLGVEKDASGKFIVHEYLTGPAQANDVLYSLSAARAAFPELSKEFVVMGPSEGGGAAWAAAQQLAMEPIAGHLGTVAMCPVTRVLSIPLDEPIVGTLIFLIVPSIAAKHPDFKLEDVLTPEGKQALDLYLQLKGCSSVLFQVIPGVDLVKPGWQNNPYIQEYQELAANGGKAIGGPLLVLQGGQDPIVYPPTTTAAVNETAKAFPSAQIEYHFLPNITHVPLPHAGQMIWMDWIAARFAKVPVKPGYHSYVAEVVRPASALQPEVNFFLQLETEGYQMT